MTPSIEEALFTLSPNGMLLPYPPTIRTLFVSPVVRAGFYNGPPLLRRGIRWHLRHLRLKIGAVVLEVAEQKIVYEIDRIVSNVAV
jgi:hypothetical protein